MSHSYLAVSITALACLSDGGSVRKIGGKSAAFYQQILAFVRFISHKLLPDDRSRLRWPAISGHLTNYQDLIRSQHQTFILRLSRPSVHLSSVSSDTL